MTSIAGYRGKAQVGAVDIQDIGTWEFDPDIAMLDDTALNAPSGAKTFVPGLFGATGSFDGNFSPSDTTGQMALHSAFFARTSVSLTLWVSDQAADGKYECTAYINKISHKQDKAGLSTIKYDFTVSGPVTFATS